MPLRLRDVQRDLLHERRWNSRSESIATTRVRAVTRDSAAATPPRPRPTSCVLIVSASAMYEFASNRRDSFTA